MHKSLSVEKRIQKKESFSTLVRKGRRSVGKNIIVWIAEKQALGGEARKQGPLLGVSVSKKVDKRAAKRNLFKRRIREAFRESQNDFEKSIAVFVQARPCETIPAQREIQQQLLQAITEEGKTKA